MELAVGLEGEDVGETDVEDSEGVEHGQEGDHGQDRSRDTGHFVTKVEECQGDL